MKLFDISELKMPNNEILRLNLFQKFSVVSYTKNDSLNIWNNPLPLSEISET